MVRGRSLLLFLLTACVVAVTVETTIDEPVDRIDVELDQGDVRIEAEPGPVHLVADFGGVGDGEFDFEVVDRVLYISGTCGGPDLCGGDIELTAPRGTAFDARVGLGSLEVAGLAGDLSLSLTSGSIEADHLSSAVVVASSGTGDIELTFDAPPTEVTAGTEAGSVAIEVPAGDYDLDLAAGSGSVEVRGVRDVDGAERRITAWVKAGSVEVVGR